MATKLLYYAGLSIAKNTIKSSSSKPNEPSQSSSSTPSKPAQPKPPSKISPNGVRFVADYEKFVPSPEDDGYGNLTVGYGHVVKKTEAFGAITQEEALSLLATDLSYAEEYVINYSATVGIIWDQNQYDAFVSLAYNSGGNFKYVMDEIVAGTDPYTAFSTIIYASGRKSLGLYRRRMDEADMFVNGTYNRTYRDWQEML